MIKVENLGFSYPGNNSPTLKGLDFFVSEGEILGFLGPNGAGKSTTQKILIKLLGNFNGNIQIEGKNLKKWSSDYYNFIGVGFELPNHYMKLTGLENLQFFASFYDVPTQNPMDLLQMVGLSKDANKRVGSYSKGMKTRLNFVRALLHKPSVLFLDEPTTGLDPNQIVEIRNIIREIGKKKTVILSTHILSEAEATCDRIVIINNGQVAADGTPTELKKILAGEIKINITIKKVDNLEIENLLSDHPKVESLEITQQENETDIAIYSTEDIRDSLYTKIKGSNWIMRNFSLEVKSLENIFRKLTKEEQNEE